jgi:ABC-type transport system involved in Fe-S cluster assembly fused permease/ATPase subunit
VLPTFLEATLVMSILGRRYGQAYFWTAFVTVASFVALTLAVVQRRVALLNDINEADNRIFTRFFNAMINNEAVRSFTNEPRASTPEAASPAAARAPGGYPLAQGCPLGPRRAPSPLGCRR